MNSQADRAAWTAYVTGEKAPKPSKYHNERAGQFASKHEAQVATQLDALARAGKIFDLQMQVPITLVEGRDNLKGIIFVADFVYLDEAGQRHVVDAKGGTRGGTRTAAYKLKKRLAKLLLDVDVEEV